MYRNIQKLKEYLLLYRKSPWSVSLNSQKLYQDPLFDQESFCGRVTRFRHELTLKKSLKFIKY